MAAPPRVYALLVPLGLAASGCRPPGPAALSATEVGPVPQAATIEGRDGGDGSLLFDRSVWIYGDTVLTVADEDGHNWHHNSYSWTTDLDGSDGIDGFTEPPDAVGAPRHLVAPTPAEAAFNDQHWGEDCPNATTPIDDAPCGARWATWPGAATWDAARDRAYVFYGLIYAEPGDFNFEGRGASVATWTDFDAGPVRPTVDPAAEHPDLVWGAESASWGTAAALVDDDLYALACDGLTLSNGCGLARAPADAVGDPAAWAYWDGSGWSAAEGDAVALFDGAPILSLAWSDALSA